MDQLSGSLLLCFMESLTVAHGHCKYHSKLFGSTAERLKKYQEKVAVRCKSRFTVDSQIDRTKTEQTQRHPTEHPLGILFPWRSGHLRPSAVQRPRGPIETNLGLGGLRFRAPSKQPRCTDFDRNNHPDC